MENILLTEKNIGAIKLKNRVLFPSMCNFYSDANGFVTNRLKMFVKARVMGGTGAIIMPGSPHGDPSPGRPAISDDRYCEGWRELAEICHQNGAKLFLQLHPATHQAGRSTKTILPHEISNEEIETIVESYALGALRAKKCGVDGVEIHGAHAHEIAQFMSPKYNKRTDSYGGDISGYVKLPVQIIEKIKEYCTTDYPIIFKISSDEKVEGGRKVEDTIKLLPYLEKAGVDAFSVSVGMAESEQYISGPMDLPPAFNIDDIYKIKQNSSVPIIALDRIINHDIAEKIISEGMADFVGVGRGQLADPEWINKIESGEELCICIGCNQSCRSSVARKEIKCTQNPSVGLEYLENIPKNSLENKKILIVGAGVAGLEACSRLCDLGVKPIIIEKEMQVGGLIALASLPPSKQSLNEIITFRINKLKKHGVNIMYGTPFSSELLSKLNPDIVIFATGSTPSEINHDLFKGDNIYTADYILKNELPTGNRVAIVGGGLVGCETAEFLSEKGLEVTIFEYSSEILQGLAKNRKPFMLSRMKDFNIEVITNAEVLSCETPNVNVRENGAEKNYSGFDFVISAIGRNPNKIDNEDLNGTENYFIGDCEKIGMIQDATMQAYELINNLALKYSQE